MYSLNLINLVQAGSITVAVLGGILLWRTPDFRGVTMLFALITVASATNILEESGVTRDIYIISPIFILLVGPITYLAILRLTKRKITTLHYTHLLPAIIALPFTTHVQMIIGVGTLFRIIYSVLSGWVLFKYKQAMDEERSDSDDFSFNWLIWLVVVMTAVNFVDLVRLNVQPLLPPAINLLGQGFNNVMWLFATMFIVVKLLEQGKAPKKHTNSVASKLQTPAANEFEYQPIFSQLENDIKDKKWYLTQRLTLNDLSELSGLQARDISRAINLIAKCSFNDYINGLRVDYVCAKIRESSKLSFTDIALASGFSSKAAFNQSFKKMKGQTPSEFKKQLGS